MKHTRSFLLGCLPERCLGAIITGNTSSIEGKFMTDEITQALVSALREIRRHSYATNSVLERNSAIVDITNIALAKYEATLTREGECP